MYIPEIPNNSLMKEIKRITELCESKINEYGEDSSWFEPGMSEKEIQKWEKDNNIVLPDTYKEWLLFSEKSLIRNNLAHFYKPDDFIFNEIKNKPDLIVIGEIFSDREFICLSKSKSIFYIYDHGDLEKKEDFREIILEIIRILDEKSSLSPKMQDLLMKMSGKLKEKQ